MRENEVNYSLTAKIFHWGFVLFFVYGIFKAVDDISQLEDDAFLRFEVFFALGFLFFLILRFFYMKKTQTTSLPGETSKWQKIAAKTVHLAMYGTLGLIAVTGLIVGLLFKLGFEKGFLVELVISLHEFGIPVMYWLISIHVIAAIYHRLLRDGVWSSMVPFWKESDKI